MAHPGPHAGQHRGHRTAAHAFVAALALALREQQPCRPRPARPVRAQQAARHLAVDREIAVAAVEARHRAPAPDREDAVALRFPGQREGRALQQVPPRRRPSLRQQRGALFKARHRRLGDDRLPAEARLGAGRRLRPHPGVHRVQHLLRHRAPEPPDPRSRHRVRVDDRSHRGRIHQAHPMTGVAQRQPQRLIALVQLVVQHSHGDLFLRLPGREVQIAKPRQVVALSLGRAVRRPVEDSHLLPMRPVERNDEVEGRAPRFPDLRIAHRHRQRTEVARLGVQPAVAIVHLVNVRRGNGDAGTAGIHILTRSVPRPALGRDGAGPVLAGIRGGCRRARRGGRALAFE